MYCHTQLICKYQTLENIDLLIESRLMEEIICEFTHSSLLKICSNVTLVEIPVRIMAGS